MHPNAELIHRFYCAFAERDHRAMAGCYAAEATFSDPAFPRLEGDRIGAMWRMLCTRGKDLELTFRDVRADDATGSAHWRAIYTFGATGRKVDNSIDARFELAGGKILRHVDTFDFGRWSRMALGPVGYLLGWTPFLAKKVQRQAAAQLDKFLARETGA